ncbi:peptide chain release factor-like protein [Acinetobacter baumannii]
MSDYIFNPSEIRIDEFRTKPTRMNHPYDSVRVTHIPSGVFVETTGSRSQYANKAKAFDELNEVLIKRQFYEHTKIYS